MEPNCPTDEINGKKRKLDDNHVVKTEPTGIKSEFSTPLELNIVDITTVIDPNSVIFDIQQVSFQSPVRKKLNLVFHLTEQNNIPIPILSIVNPTTNIPDLSIINLATSVKLCVLIPLLNNSTNHKKKMIASLCFWLDPVLKSDPIILQINLDLIKKNLVKLGKLPADIDDQFEDNESPHSLDLSRVQETIIDYFTRQFKLCGVNLINYLPGKKVFKNDFILNDDHAIALSRLGKPALIICDSHKGAKEGSLLLLSKNEISPAYIIFGFKKPILQYETSTILSKSYSNITRLTFNLTLNIEGEPKPIEFSMIDQKYHHLIEEFLIENNIEDESFAQELREKVDVKDEPISETAQLIGNLDEDEDEEDDDFDENNIPDDSDDVADEFDSDANTDDEDQDIFQGGKEEDDDGDIID